MMWPWGSRATPVPPEQDPVVVGARQTAAQLQDAHANLRAGEQERVQLRREAEKARRTAEALVARNHFSESIEAAMRGRGAR